MGEGRQKPRKQIAVQWDPDRAAECEFFVPLADYAAAARRENGLDGRS